MNVAVHHMAIHKWTQHKRNQSRGYPLDYAAIPYIQMQLLILEQWFYISYCSGRSCFLVWFWFFFLFQSLFLMARDWFPAFSDPWVRLLRKLCSAGSFLLCCSCQPEWWLRYCTGPRVTQEASLAGKKLLINYDNWKIGLVVTSPEQDNANREHELHAHF